MNLLDSFDLTQHVKGHTLDLVITRSDKSLISNLNIYNPLISDHEAILFSFAAERPRPVEKDIQYRSLTKINFAKFCQDIGSSALCNAAPSAETSELATLYNTELTRILDAHAPLKSKMICDRNGCEWFTDELGDLKRHKQKLERRHKTTMLTIDLDIYKQACAAYEARKLEVKKEYYNNEVRGCLNDHGALFQIIKRLLHRSSTSPLPSHESPSVLAQEFADFFESKIDKIHQKLNVVDSSDLQDKLPTERTTDTLLQSCFGK